MSQQNFTPTEYFTMDIVNEHKALIVKLSMLSSPPNILVTWQCVSSTLTNVGGKANHNHYIEYFPFISSDIYILPRFCVGRALGCYLNNISAPLPLPSYSACGHSQDTLKMSLEVEEVYNL